MRFREGSRIVVVLCGDGGATTVSFHGTEAKFKVVSKSLITTEVPTGATTGKVKVQTPHGTLVSNVVFRVKP